MTGQKSNKRPIDNVTTTNLDIALRMCHIEISIPILDKIIDLIELIEDNGDDVTIGDVCALQASWKLTAELNNEKP
jgi:hypothetical protein